MKRLILILISGILFPYIGYSQSTNLQDLPEAERENKAIEIAIAAMKKYAPSYHSEDITPVLHYHGPNRSKYSRYSDRMMYVVKFPFDLTKAIEENREGENVYGGLVSILEETGKAISILPTGWWTIFEIPDADVAPHSGQVSGGVAGSSGSSSGAVHRIAEPTKVPRNPFKNQ